MTLRELIKIAEENPSKLDSNISISVAPNDGEPFKRYIGDVHEVIIHQGENQDIVICSDGYSNNDEEEDSKTNWQPIETAPKDGTRVLLFYKVDSGYEAKYMDVGFYNQYGNDEWDVWWELDASASVVYPTYWMPLPEPPKEESK